MFIKCWPYIHIPTDVIILYFLLIEIMQYEYFQQVVH